MGPLSLISCEGCTLNEDEGYQQEIEIRRWLEEYDPEYEPKKRGEEVNINDIYKSDSGFLKAEDLRGSSVRVTIAGWDLHEFDRDGKADQKAVLSFEGKEKRLTLNVTNARAIAKLHGDDMDNWVGAQIIIYPTTTDFGDKKDVPCIRVQEELPELSEAKF